ncbi:hypothetical protein K435DRAFT_831981 [Dendrothele bispora CBS 962.96]|uniref:HNH nuclease domain-containing protein n=1 Tax=Dendrothele bispora (strain CBS 962.96) TaxID=1314807 RepID=A0A4S8KX25_DENBC|nr:hypothetical protein K435DRAFT_831981 [Dendrothele bispora CBS 962.96]
MQSEPEVWTDLKNRNWIPTLKMSPEHEPRNGLLIILPSKHIYTSYVSFPKQAFTEPFVFVNYSQRPAFQYFHGKVTALNIGDSYSPFPSLFIIHKMRIISEDVLDHGAAYNSHNRHSQSQIQLALTTTSTRESVDILAATPASPSWKARQAEGTSWNGTTEENVQKYISSIGIEPLSD